jgi:hypothetical protein
MLTARAFVPRLLRRGVISQELDGELLLYVEETHRASSLNASAARVWALCDGKRSAAMIAVEANLDTDVLMATLRQFAKAGLIENGDEIARFTANLSRRKVLVGVGLAVPVILMVMAPGAAAAASCVQPGQACTAGTCCIGNCSITTGTCPE